MSPASGRPPGTQSDAEARLHRCVRDLAALHALPSMCVGRAPEETLDIVLDALPTLLGCDFVLLDMPGTPRRDGGMRGGARVPRDELGALASLQASSDATFDVPGLGPRYGLDAQVVLGPQRGRLLVGRATPLDPETDRVLVSAAAVVVGTTLETAVVLEAAREKDDFLAMLGHELRNPLAPIVTAVELLGRHPTVQREQQVIERNTRHLSRLVDDLLDISRVTRGNVELRREPVPLDLVLDRAVEIAAPLMVRAGHQLHVGRTPGVVLEGDPVRLAQVFANLLTNAAKFTPAGGRVDVDTTRDEKRVRVVVRDTGRGLDRGQLERIFAPFVQVDRAADALRGGLGLGLAIVRSLVERHGGTITASSEGRGRGATFTVELPLAAQVAVPVAPAAPRRSSRGGMRVLVVDDNEDVAEMLSLSLSIAGIETQLALDGRTAIQRWREFSPHAGVLDLGLPGFDGYQVARELRAEHGPGPTLIAATGYGQQRDRMLTAEAGFDCHFVKPVRVDDLLAVLDQRVRVA